jgi:hypothetical protein
VLDKLRDEIELTVGIGSSAPLPTRVDLKKMHYLDMVIKEGANIESPHYCPLTN